MVNGAADRDFLAVEPLVSESSTRASLPSESDPELDESFGPLTRYPLLVLLRCLKSVKDDGGLDCCGLGWVGLFSFSSELVSCTELDDIFFSACVLSASSLNISMI